MGNEQANRKINLVLLVLSLAIGVVTQFVAYWLQPALATSIPQPFFIGCSFLLLYIVLMAAITILGKIRRTFEDNLLYGGASRKGIVPTLVIGAVLILLLASAFELLYELEGDTQSHEPTSFIFAIDDSGSMQGSDPENARNGAIKKALEDKPDTFPFAVYRFSSDSALVREMSPQSDGIPEFEWSDEGATAIKGTLNRVIQDKQSGIWDGGEYPRLILLSDGYATDIEWFDTLSQEMRQYWAEGMSISTVGLGGVDTLLMRRLAQSTGGVYVNSPDDAGLSEAMSAAAVRHADRNLVSTRYPIALDGLYAFLRIIFLSILGIVIGVFAVIAYGSKSSTRLILASTVITSFLGALVMEFGMGVFGLSDFHAWLLLWMLISCTIATMRRKPKRGKGNGDVAGSSDLNDGFGSKSPPTFTWSPSRIKNSGSC